MTDPLITIGEAARRLGLGRSERSLRWVAKRIHRELGEGGEG